MNGAVFSGKTLTGELALGKYKIPQVAEEGGDLSSVTFITGFLVTRLINLVSSLASPGQCYGSLALVGAPHNSANTWHSFGNDARAIYNPQKGFCYAQQRSCFTYQSKLFLFKGLCSLDVHHQLTECNEFWWCLKSTHFLPTYITSEAIFDDYATVVMCGEST